MSGKSMRCELCWTHGREFLVPAPGPFGHEIAIMSAHMLQEHGIEWPPPKSAERSS